MNLDLTQVSCEKLNVIIIAIKKDISIINESPHIKFFTLHYVELKKIVKCLYLKVLLKKRRVSELKMNY